MKSPNDGEFLLYQAPDGHARLQVRLTDGTLWLTQQQLSDLYQSTPQNITQHIRAIYAEGEADEAATCKPYLQVRSEGGRSISRSLKHYNLDMVLAIGYRVRSHRGAQFRQWATDTLKEYMVKGFAMDDARLKHGADDDYFDELLARIRDIRSSERICGARYKIFTPPALITIRKTMCRKVFSPPCKTRCISPLTGKRPQNWSASVPTPASPTWV